VTGSFVGSKARPTAKAELVDRERGVTPSNALQSEVGLIVVWDEADDGV
jgi:hypothetical protein